MLLIDRDSIISIHLSGWEEKQNIKNLKQCLNFNCLTPELHTLEKSAYILTNWHKEKCREVVESGLEVALQDYLPFRLPPRTLTFL